jgi:CBS domain-containing protein
MHAEVLTCPADAPLAVVASIMASERIHCVIVEGTTAGGRGWSIVSDLDLVAAGSTGLDEQTAGRSAATEFPTVTPDEKLIRASQLMVDHETAHVIVVDRKSDRALGVLSTLDVAGAIAAADA